MNKKTANITFIISLTIFICILILGILCASFSRSIEKQISNSSSTQNEITSEHEIDDVEGYGMIISVIGKSLTGFSILIINLLSFMLFFYSFLLFIFPLIARLIVGNTPGRLIAYRILMGISSILHAIIELVLIHALIEEFVLFIFVPAFLLFFAILIELVNTYRNTAST